eukprot:52065_1
MNIDQNSKPPPAPTPLSPPIQNDIDLSPATADPYTIPDTPYISPHSNRATDGNVSAYDPTAFDSEYVVRDLSGNNISNPPANTLNHNNDNIKPPNTDKQSTKHKSFVGKIKSLFSTKCVVICIIILIMIIAIAISISVYSTYSKRSQQQNTIDEIEQLKKELEKLEHQNTTNDKLKTTQHEHKTTQQTNKDNSATKRTLMSDLMNQSSSVSTHVSTTMFITIVLFTIALGMFTSFAILHL